jgi:hypothetical protein
VLRAYPEGLHYLEQALIDAQRRLDKTQRWLHTHCEQTNILQARLDRFEQENRDNPEPIEIRFRLDAGFRTYENNALLIEMSYELYIKLHNHKMVQALQKRVRP